MRTTTPFLHRLLAAVSCWCALGALAQTGSDTTASPRPTVVVHAAGSLRAAMGELARSFEQAEGGSIAVRTVFGPSGLLKDRIVGGEASQVFASANMDHPEALHQAGKAEAARAFARNALCLLALPGFSLQGRPVAQRLLDPDVRLATSTPKADPAGDYAFQMFDRIEQTGAGPAGSAAALKAKALQLTGGPQHAAPPAGRSAYAMVMGERQADVFVTYCTNAEQARHERAELQVIAIPASTNVAATYGIALVRPVSPPAQRFVDFVLGDAGQRLLEGHGFSRP